MLAAVVRLLGEISRDYATCQDGQYAALMRAIILASRAY